MTITLAHNEGCQRKGNGIRPCTCRRRAAAEALEKLGFTVEYTEERPPTQTRGWS